MTTGKSVELTFKFKVTALDYDAARDFYYEAKLVDVNPKGVYNHHYLLKLPPEKKEAVCHFCDEDKAGQSIIDSILCDAHAAEMSIECSGEVDILEGAGVKLDRTGTLIAKGYIEWSHYSGIDGEEYDEEIIITSHEWVDEVS